MPKMGNTFLTMQELEKKKEYLLGLSSVIPTWNASYQFLFKEIQQELLGKVNEKLKTSIHFKYMCRATSRGIMYYIQLWYIKKRPHSVSFLYF